MPDDNDVFDVDNMSTWDFFHQYAKIELAVFSRSSLTYKEFINPLIWMLTSWLQIATES